MTLHDGPNHRIVHNDIDINVVKPDFFPGHYGARDLYQDMQDVYSRRIENYKDNHILPRLDLAMELTDKQPGINNISPKEMAAKLSDGELRAHTPIGRALREAVREASASGGIQVGEVVSNLNDILERHGRMLKVVGTPEGQRPFRDFRVTLVDVDKNVTRGVVIAPNLGRK